jgi:8-oxo-dGTP pyrophosphatase MutT (NUDIX family)
MFDLNCNDSARKLIAGNVSMFKRTELPCEGSRRAAVALTIVNFNGDGNLKGLCNAKNYSASLVLTRRAKNLKKHAGQWALPGGSVDKDETVEETALRELEEEVGLKLSEDSIIGKLDDFITRSGFHITPVVIWGGEVLELQKNEKEVASIHRIPFAELMREDAPLFENGEEASRPILYMPVGSTYIATPTAAILFQFREVALRGVTTRVSHFDQPYFAWR